MDKKELYAGAGKAAIQIPKLFFQWSDEFVGIHDDLSVRAIIMDNGERVCLVSIEIAALMNDCIQTLQAFISQWTGIPSDHIWIMVSHCLSAPRLMNLCMHQIPGEKEKAESVFFEAMITALHEAVEKANATMRRAYLSLGSTESFTNVNGDIQSTNGWRRGPNPNAHCHHTVTIFQLQDERKQIISILYHFGVHSSVMWSNNEKLVSADLTGVASSYVEKKKGGVAILLLGACGNQIPREMGTYVNIDTERNIKVIENSKDAWGVLERLGNELGDDVLRIAESGCKAVENPGIAMYNRIVELPAFTQKGVSSVCPIPTNCFVGSEVEGKRPIPISVLRIGRIGLMGVQPEINGQTAVRLQEDTMFLGTLTVQMVNGYAGYLPEAEAYDNFTYEAAHSFFPKGSAELLMKEAVKLLCTVQDSLHKIDPKIAAKYPDRLMDIPYGIEDPSQKMDIWYPNDKGKDPLPVVLMLHGGAFQHGDKFEDSTEPMLRGLERGYVIVSGNYRLAPESTYPTPILDGKQALHYLRANAEALGIDPDRIAVWGFSSGAWLVSMIAVTAENPNFSVGSEYSEKVQAVIDWCGPCGNFLEMDRAIIKTGIGCADHSDRCSPESLFMGAKITDIPERCTEACPISYISKDTPPVLIIHGDADPVVPLDQSVRFYQALRRTGCDVRMHIEPGKGHHGECWYHEHWLSDLCFDFLDQKLKKSDD